MDILVLDFETFYDKDFSLSKITTEEYIRSPKFEVVGVAVKRNDEPTTWFSEDFKATRKWLQQWDIPNSAVCAQNAHFDVAILNWIYGLRPARIIDTLSMANVLHGVNESCSLSNLAKIYGIGEKGTEVIKAQGKRREDFSPSELSEYGAYCINDVDLTHVLMHYMMPQFPKKELKLIDLTVRMFTEPKLRLDKNLLSEALHQLGVERRTLILNLMRELGVKNEETLKKQLMSNEQFAQLLRENGVEPPTKISPTTGKTAYAFAKTDEEFTILEDHPNPTIQALFAARMGFKSTIGITRTEAFLSIAERGTFPFPLKYSGASVTHRWSGFDVNPQNLSRIDPDKPKPSDALRKAIIAPPGYKIVVADLSNIELRLGLWLAGQDDKLDLTRQGVDLYRDFAAQAYNVAYDSISKKDPARFVGKCAQLSLIFGTGAAKLQNTVRIQSKGMTTITENEAVNLTKLYRTGYNKVVDAWSEGSKVLDALLAGQTRTYLRNGVVRIGPAYKNAAGFVLNNEVGLIKPNGLVLVYPDLKKSINKETGKVEYTYAQRRARDKVYGSKVFQKCVQSLARDIMAEIIVSISKLYNVVGTVHDEVVLLVPEDHAEAALEELLKIMCTPPAWAPDLPLDAEGGIGDSYGEAK